VPETQDPLTEARNRRLFALIGGALAAVVVLACLIALLAVDGRPAAGTDHGHPIPVVIAG
jgi:hypothetical protein